MPSVMCVVLACGMCLSTVSMAAPPVERTPSPSPNSNTTPNLRRAGPALTPAEGALAPVHASLLLEGAPSARASDTFTGEALVQDSAGAFYLDDDQSGGFLLDGLPELGGTSLVNSSTFMFMSDAVTELGASTLVQVEMGAYDANGAPTLWVDSSGTGIGLDTWRLDVGTHLGGTDPIDLGSPFTTIASGMVVFASDGSIIGEFPIELDASTTTSLAGVATVGLGGAEIAGFDLFSIQLWWEVELDPTDPGGGGGDCAGDMNGDGYVDIADINAFLESFLAGCP